MADNLRDAVIQALDKVTQNMNAIIVAHNRIVAASCNVAPGVRREIAGEGHEIAYAARHIGINAKVNMQTGEIAVYPDTKPSALWFYSNCGGSSGLVLASTKLEAEEQLRAKFGDSAFNFSTRIWPWGED